MRLDAAAKALAAALRADDILQLLALAILNERRGNAACRPTDAAAVPPGKLSGLVPGSASIGTCRAPVYNGLC